MHKSALCERPPCAKGQKKGSPAQGELSVVRLTEGSALFRGSDPSGPPLTLRATSLCAREALGVHKSALCERPPCAKGQKKGSPAQGELSAVRLTEGSASEGGIVSTNNSLHRGAKAAIFHAVSAVPALHGRYMCRRQKNSCESYCWEFGLP